MTPWKKASIAGVVVGVVAAAISHTTDTRSSKVQTLDTKAKEGRKENPPCGDFGPFWR
jgi:hypothetical protein